LKWWEEYYNLKLNKIKNHYINSLESDIYKVKCFKSNHYVESIRTENIEIYNVRYSRNYRSNQSVSITKSNEQLNTFYRMFKSKLNNLKNQKYKQTTNNNNDFAKLIQKKERLQKHLISIEENKDIEVSAAKRKYDKYLILKQLQTFVEEEIQYHKASEKKEQELLDSDDVILTKKKLGKFRLKESTKPNYDLNNKLTSNKRMNDYRYTTDQILYIKRSYNDHMHELKLRKRELLELIKETKIKVNDLNLKLRVENTEELFNLPEFFDDEEEIANK